MKNLEEVSHFAAVTSMAAIPWCTHMKTAGVGEELGPLLLAQYSASNEKETALSSMLSLNDRARFHPGLHCKQMRIGVAASTIAPVRGTRRSAARAEQARRMQSRRGEQEAEVARCRETRRYRMAKETEYARRSASYALQEQRREAERRHAESLFFLNLTSSSDEEEEERIEGDATADTIALRRLQNQWGEWKRDEAHKKRFGARTVGARY